MNELATTDRSFALVAHVKDAKLAMDAIRTLQADVLREGIDFGVIPGTGNKPTLLKPGSESLLMAFRLSTGEPVIEYIQLEHLPGHIEIRVKVPIIHRESGTLIGYGLGSCSTAEKKYRYRNGERVCPACGKATIIKGREEYGGGWLCFAKKGGCGAKYGDRDDAIIGQAVGQIENPDPADQYNTVLKMAKKRALVDGALTCTAASGVFTQDVEDFADFDRYHDPEPAHTPPPPAEVVNADCEVEHTYEVLSCKYMEGKGFTIAECMGGKALIFDGEESFISGDKIAVFAKYLNEQAGLSKYKVSSWRPADVAPPLEAVNAE